MNAAGFVNRIRSLWNLDRSDVPFISDEAWLTFRDNPPAFLIRTDEATADRIFAAVEHRQKCTIPQAAADLSASPAAPAPTIGNPSGLHNETEAVMAAALQYLRGQDPNTISGAIRNGDLRSRLKWVLIGCGGPLRAKETT